MIEARGLVQTFHTGQGKNKKEVHAVKGVDLDVAEGEVVGFLGPNGAGKTTTLRMLVTLLTPTAGTATGRRLRRRDRARPGPAQHRLLLPGRLDVLRRLRRRRGRRPRDALRDVPQGRRGQGPGAVREVPARRALEADEQAHVRRPEAPARHRDGADPLADRSCSSTSRPPGSTRRRGRTSGSTSRGCAANEGATVFLTTHYLDEADALARPDRHHRPRRDRGQRHRRQPQGQRLR